MKNIYVGFSGGADSTCLLYILNKLIKTNPDFSEYNLIAIHVNHMIRKKDAALDEKFCMNFCIQNNINYIPVKIDVPKFSKLSHVGLEEGARICRYNIYKKICGNDIIFLAHHMNDQAETIIQNIIRGSGLKGLCGMKSAMQQEAEFNIDENVFNKCVQGKFEYDKTAKVLNINRPFIEVSKETIEEYLKNKKIKYVTDITNFDDNYARNYIRLNVIPDMEKLNSKVTEHISELSKLAYDIDKDYYDFAYRESSKILSVGGNNKNIVSIEINDIKKYSDIKIYYILSYAIFDILKVNKKDWNKKHFGDCINMIKKEAGGHIDLPCNITADKKNKIITFIKNDYNVSMDSRKKK